MTAILLISFSIYQPGDTLTFNDNYTPRHFTRAFSTMWDTRSMSQNGSRYEYCIPKQVNYGCAVTGIRDDLKATVPVKLTLDRYDDYRKVPARNFSSSAFSSKRAFTATAAARGFNDQFMSNAVVIYRCAPAGLTFHRIIHIF